MIYLFYGGAQEDRAGRVAKLEATLMKANVMAPLSSLEFEDFTEERLDELAHAQGLFHVTSAYLLRGFLEGKEQKEFFIKKAKPLGISKNIFIVSEPSATKELISAGTKAGGEAEEVGEKEKAPKRESSSFALADALARRDRKLAWALYFEAVHNGAAPEELHGMLFWQVKNLYLAKEGGDAGKFSYPLMKAKSFAPKWEKEELREALSRLVRIYHESHRGRADFPTALESFLLETA
ncbi:hypothetical protein KW797_01100 [Candidatus Parcubacteria bacterium]|nr:hypothetical protein [Candidatus Parcubacteria bacterium]